MGKKHYVIIVPGLGDETQKIKWVTNHWRKYGLEPILRNFRWKSGEKHFKPKLKRLISHIDDLLEGENKVSLVGASAGGSAVLNAFAHRRNKISKVITVCARLKRGKERGLRSYERRTKESPPFGESILMLEKLEPKLTMADRKKIMTIRAIFDELVPDDTAQVRGATNNQIKSIEHMFSIWMALGFYKPTIKFLKGVS